MGVVLPFATGAEDAFIARCAEQRCLDAATLPLKATTLSRMEGCAKDRQFNVCTRKARQ